MTNGRARVADLRSMFSVIRHSSFFRHSCFVIRHYPRAVFRLPATILMDAGTGGKVIASAPVLRFTPFSLIPVAASKARLFLLPIFLKSRVSARSLPLPTRHVMGKAH